MNSLNNFMKNAVGLTKNPLGIIGLFISLIYGFACLVLSTSIANLNSPNERLPLIWFIIVFPIAILGAFIYLVVNHHEKLYAPSDFRNDEAFIETLSGKKIKEKQEKEIEILNSASDSENKSTQTSTAEKTESKKQEPNELIDTNFKEDLSQRVSNAEKWAVKDLELKYKTLFKTNQRLLANNVRIDLDAYSSSQDKVTIAEIKYWESNKAIKPLLLSLQEYILKLDKFKTVFKNKEVELIIVLVFDKIKEENLSQIQNFLSELDGNVKLEVKDYYKLLNEYRE